MTEEQFKKQYNLTEDQFVGKELIKGNLYLYSVKTLPEGFNPTVGGNLDLDSVTTLPEGFNPTVRESLDLRSVTTLPKGFNPTVGENLILKSWKTPMSQEELKKRFPNVKGKIITKY